LDGADREVLNPPKVLAAIVVHVRRRRSRISRRLGGVHEQVRGGIGEDDGEW
jgi:hypothetical protein